MNFRINTATRHTLFRCRLCGRLRDKDNRAPHLRYAHGIDGSPMDVYAAFRAAEN